MFYTLIKRLPIYNVYRVGRITFKKLMRKEMSTVKRYSLLSLLAVGLALLSSLMGWMFLQLVVAPSPVIYSFWLYVTLMSLFGLPKVMTTDYTDTDHTTAKE